MKSYQVTDLSVMWALNVSGTCGLVDMLVNKLL